MAESLDQLQIDFLILADRAEVINGKLYMMGGAWDRQGVLDFKQPVVVSMAVGVLVPWTFTNEAHSLRVIIEHEDGAGLKPEVTGSFTLGRPPNATKGQTFRAMVAITGSWTLPGPGAYRVVASVGEDQKRTVFYADQLNRPIPTA